MNSATTQSLTIQTNVDPMWVTHVTGGVEGFCDVFFGSYSGYWARGVAHTKELGWLVYEHGGETSYTECELRVAKNLWRAGRPLPEKWHRFNEEAANKGWLEGVKRFGEQWFDNGDGPRYDWALQMGLLGEARYG